MSDLTAFDLVARGLLDRHANQPLRALPTLRRVFLKRTDLVDALLLARLETLSASPGRKATEEDAAAGHLSTDAHANGAGGGSSSSPARKPIRVREHRRAKKRTDADRALARAAMAQSLVGVFARPILGRPLGQYRWRELPELRRTLAIQAIDHVMLGRDAAENAILIDKLLCYAKVVEPDALVNDVISAEHMAELEIEASRQALPKLDVSKGAAHAEFVRQLEYQGAAS